MGRVLGPILLLQVQTAPLTQEGGYDLSRLIRVEALRLTPDGVFGLREGEWIVDLHHREHPRTRFREGRNALSLGLSGHYARMADRYGQVPLGVGGENLIVDGPSLTLEDLTEGIEIEVGGGRTVRLGEVRVCQPCVYFARHVSGRWALREELKEELGFLGAGTRGFLISLDHLEETLVVRVGDQMAARPAAKSSAASSS